MRSNDESSRDAAQSAPWWDTDDWIVHIEDELRVEQMAVQKISDMRDYQHHGAPIWYNGEAATFIGIDQSDETQAIILLKNDERTIVDRKLLTPRPVKSWLHNKID